MKENNKTLKIDNVSKQYKLGVIGAGTLSHDINKWWHKIRGKENPYLKIGEVNDRSDILKSGYVWALKNINFELEKGEVFGIIGRNGAGKSTILKILSKVTGPTTGKILFNGKISSLLEVGTGFHPELTGKENIFLNGTILGMSKKEIKLKLDEIIDFSGCKKYIDTPVKRYSSGMKVRLAFAVAAHLEPDILVVDEVLAVGDIHFQKKAIGKMKEISKESGRTIIFVSHDMNAIKNLCQRVMVLENGVSVFIGETNEAIKKYISLNKNTDILSKNDTIGNIKINEIKFINNDNLIEVFLPIIIKIDITFLNHIPENLEVGLYIKDEFGTVLTTLSTWLNGNNLKTKNKNTVFECKLETGFSLIEGIYFMDIKFKGIEQSYFVDYLKFEIFNSIKSNYKRKLNSNFHGFSYTPNQWKIK